MRIPKCVGCVHYLIRNTCKAYPEGIPREILWSRIFHSEKLNGQVGDFIFEPKNPQLERAAQESAEKFKQELIVNADNYRKEFSDLLLKQLEENQLHSSDWNRIVLEVDRKEGWDTVLERIEFYAEIGGRQVRLDIKYFRAWSKLRRRLWRLKNMNGGKRYSKMEYVLDRNGGLEVRGLREFEWKIFDPKRSPSKKGNSDLEGLT